MLVSLIFIDNYDEVVDTVEEIRLPLLTALIDSRLNNLAQQVGGIVRKFEKDRYIFLFSRDKLDYLRDRNFDILDQIRNIDMGNEIPVTLSIGIGMGGETLSQSMEYARAAIDLALGRGGDQVLIKDNDKYYFYGGITKEKGHNTMVRARVKAYALDELIEAAPNVVIMGHKNADPDCLGAGIGIFRIVKNLNKPCHLILNNVTSNIHHLYQELMKHKEYKEGIINGQEALSKINPNTLLVIVDTHRPSLVEEAAALKLSNKIVVFDHHRKSAEFVDNPVLTYHEPYASSTAELITEMLQYSRAAVRLLPLEANSLLAGITVDTKNFSVKTGTRTFEAAAYLKRSGADSVRVRMMFRSNLITYKAKALAVSNAEIINNKVAVSICEGDIENPSLTAAQAANELLDIDGITASFVACKTADGAVIISARSLQNVNVQALMEQFGGGGHQTVAGAQILDRDIEEVLNDLREMAESL